MQQEKIRRVPVNQSNIGGIFQKNKPNTCDQSNLDSSRPGTPGKVPLARGPVDYTVFAEAWLFHSFG